MIIKKPVVIKKIEKAQFVGAGESANGVIQLDGPLMIALFEYVNEYPTTNYELQKMTERLLQHSLSHVVTMNCYSKIIGTEEQTIPMLSEKSTLFRMNSRTLWSRFGWSPLNFSIALNNNLEGLSETENRIYTQAAKIGDFVVPYYGEEIGKALGDALINFGQIGVAVMRDLKGGIPLDGTKTRWDQSVENLATLLSTINPDYWPKEPVKSYFDTLVNFWIDSIRARQSKDFDADSVAIDGIEKLVTMGIGDSPSLADVFSAGIIAQFPEKFID